MRGVDKYIFIVYYDVIRLNLPPVGGFFKNKGKN